ncbi:MAG: YciI family protein [Polyangiaceae bacterium]
MTSYALLIYRTASADEPIPEHDDRAALLGHRALQVEASSRGDLHAVARLDEPRAAKTVRVRADGHDIMDGPFIESKEWLVGFYLIECADEAQAITRARQICGDPHHVIEVRPVNWRWRA